LDRNTPKPGISGVIRWLIGIIIGIFALCAIGPVIWTLAIYFYAYVLNGTTG
jgi:hypothetical protein